MPGQGRLGDKAQVPADAHGCPACPHPATGPAVNGSANVNVNGRPALREGDHGFHAACCATNQWTAQSGSATVFINGKAAHRLSDTTRHCGGTGQLVEGSPDVIVGDATSGGGGGGGGGGAGGGGASASSGAPSASPAPSAAPAPESPPPEEPEPKLVMAQWSTERAGPGDDVTLSVDSEDHPPGTPLTIVLKTRDGDEAVQTIQAQVTGDTTQVRWRYDHDQHGGDDHRDRPADRLPDYYYEATVGSETKRSGILAIRTTLRIVVKDKAGRPLRFARYTAKLVGGRTVEGQTNERGETVLEEVPPGSVHIKLLDHKGIEFDT